MVSKALSMDLGDQEDTNLEGRTTKVVGVTLHTELVATEGITMAATTTTVVDGALKAQTTGIDWE